jgi:hypothetical protein
VTYTDPANRSEIWSTDRDPALDMFAPANGFDLKTRLGTYSREFAQRFYQAKGARNERVIAFAQWRLSEIEKGKGQFGDDQPLTIPASQSARLLKADSRILSHTHNPHPLIRADGTVPVQIVPSVRPSLITARSAMGELQSAQVTTVRRFLAEHALRTTRDYNMTEDSISGIDWTSSSSSAISNIEGITVPTLIVAMSCHYFLVPDEILYEHSRAKDKQYALIEGASHVFAPCRPEYGDTQKRLFDYIDKWLSEPSRMLPRRSEKRVRIVNPLARIQGHGQKISTKPGNIVPGALSLVLAMTQIFNGFALSTQFALANPKAGWLSL